MSLQIFKVQLVYNIVLVSGVQQSYSVIYIYMCVYIYIYIERERDRVLSIVDYYKILTIAPFCCIVGPFGYLFYV